MQLQLSINGSHKCQVKFEAHHTFERVITLLKNNKLVPVGLDEGRIEIENARGDRFQRESFVMDCLIPPETNRGSVNISFPTSVISEATVKKAAVDIMKKLFVRVKERKFKELRELQNHHEEVIRIVIEFAKMFEETYARGLFYKAVAGELDGREKAELEEFKVSFREEFERVEAVRQSMADRLKVVSVIGERASDEVKRLTEIKQSLQMKINQQKATFSEQMKALQQSLKKQKQKNVILQVQRKKLQAEISSHSNKNKLLENSMRLLQTSLELKEKGSTSFIKEPESSKTKLQNLLEEGKKGDRVESQQKEQREINALKKEIEKERSKVKELIEQSRKRQHEQRKRQQEQRRKQVEKEMKRQMMKQKEQMMKQREQMMKKRDEEIKRQQEKQKQRMILKNEIQKRQCLQSQMMKLFKEFEEKQISFHQESNKLRLQKEKLQMVRLDLERKLKNIERENSQQMLKCAEQLKERSMLKKQLEEVVKRGCERQKEVRNSQIQMEKNVNVLKKQTVELKQRLAILSEQKQKLQREILSLNQQLARVKEVRIRKDPIAQKIKLKENKKVQSFIAADQLTGRLGVNVSKLLLQMGIRLMRKVTGFKVVYLYNPEQRRASRIVNNYLSFCSNILLLCKTRRGGWLGGFTTFIRMTDSVVGTGDPKPIQGVFPKAFLFGQPSGQKQFSFFNLKGNCESLTEDSEFLVFGNEQLCLQYGEASVSRMLSEHTREDKFRYEQGARRKDFFEGDANEVGLQWFWILSCEVE